MMRALLVALALVIAVASARGEVPTSTSSPLRRGFDTIPNKPAVGVDSFITVEAARPSAAGTFRLALLGDFNTPALGLQLGTTPISPLIPARLDFHLLGSYTISRRFEIGAALPVTAFQSNRYQQLADLGFSNDPSDQIAAHGVSDFRIVPRVFILDPDEFPLGLAAVLEVRLPTGDKNSFLGDLGPVFAPRLTAERTLGPVRLGANLGYRLRSKPGQYFNLYVGQELTFGAAASLELPKPDRLPMLRGLVELTGATSTSAPFSLDRSEVLKTPLELLVGARSRFTDHLGAELSFATGLTGRTGSGYGRELFRVIFGLRYDFSAADRDNDGVPDAEDKCPDVPEDRDGFEDSDGCPDPDNDKDGLPDVEDRCPNQAGPREYGGCPDTDGDEIPDAEDKCPDQPGPPENEGCPVEKPPYVVIEANKLRLKANIRFDTGQATIKKESFPILNEVADVLKAHPEIEKMRVDGHTDNVGPAKFNNDLSERRARAVVDYLEKRGAAADRLSSHGFGFEKPVASNDTPLGRAKNRRVEFTILKGAPLERSGPPPAPPPSGPPPAPPK